jgi:hypothetical protein
MSKTKKYQCPSCGGDLTVDNDKQMYCCTLCGSTYDYDHFREEQLHKTDGTHLSRKEFGAVVDAYRSSLKTNPHDFSALRGLMLAAAFLKNMDDLVRAGEAKHFSYNSIIVKEVIECAPEEDKEYFKKFARLYEVKKKQIDCNRGIESLHRDRERIEAAMRLTEDTRRDYYIKAGKYGKWHPKAYFIFGWCNTALFLILELIIAGVLDSTGTGGVVTFLVLFGGLTLLIGIGVNFGYVFPRFKIMKEIDTYMEEYKTELSLTEEKLKEHEAEAVELSEEIRKIINDFIWEDEYRITGKTQQ